MKQILKWSYTFFLLAICLSLSSCWLFDGRVSTPEERQAANLAVDTAVATERLTPAQAAEIKALIEQSKDSPQTWQSVMMNLATLGLGYLAARHADKQPERAAKKAAIKRLIANPS